jgi:hypothetical protein
MVSANAKFADAATRKKNSNNFFILMQQSGAIKVTFLGYQFNK